MQPMQRQTAYKLKIGEIFQGNQILDGTNFNSLELGDKKIVRVNIVANVIEKYESEGEKKFLSLTIDDASGQIKVKSFGEDVDKFKDIGQGNTVMVVGMLRFYNNELYVLPEIVKALDPRYLLVRKLELDNGKPKIEVPKEERRAIKDQIIDMIKIGDATGGIEVDQLILQLKAEPEIINQEIQKLLEEGLAYEPRPGKIRYLG
jgi:uncharacterized protein